MTRLLGAQSIPQITDSQAFSGGGGVSQIYMTVGPLFVFLGTDVLECILENSGLGNYRANCGPRKEFIWGEKSLLEDMSMESSC